jgi:hypothetical protein
MFATRNLSKAVAAGNFVDRGDVAYGPSSIDSSTHGIKQIVLWMDIFYSPNDPAGTKRPACIARQDKGGSMAL